MPATSAQAANPSAAVAMTRGATALTYTITGLVNGSTYDVEVTYVERRDEGGFWIRYTTDEGKPEFWDQLDWSADYVARLVGLNLLQGTARGHLVELVTGGTVYVAATVGGSVHVAFRPAAVSLFTSRRSLHL